MEKTGSDCDLYVYWPALWSRLFKDHAGDSDQNDSGDFDGGDRNLWTAENELPPGDGGLFWKMAAETISGCRRNGAGGGVRGRQLCDSVCPAGDPGQTGFSRHSGSGVDGSEHCGHSPVWLCGNAVRGELSLCGRRGSRRICRHLGRRRGQPEGQSGILSCAGQLLSASPS